MMLRRVLLLFLLAVPLAASAGEPPYITAQELDLVSILPPPIAAGSEADRAQLAVVLRAQLGDARAHRPGTARRRRIGRHPVRRRARQGAARGRAAGHHPPVRAPRGHRICRRRSHQDRLQARAASTSATRRSRRWSGRRSPVPIPWATPRTARPWPSSCGRYRSREARCDLGACPGLRVEPCDRRHALSQRSRRRQACRHRDRGGRARPA